MKHPFALKLMKLSLAALVMLTCVTRVKGQSNDVPGRVTVSVPGAGLVDIQINSFENPSKSAGNKTLLAVHGLAHTGATFEPLASELFKKTGRDKIDRVLALNFPGRNESGLPSNALFGNLTVEDYTAVLLGVLDELAKHVNIESIIGHSMGGLIVQLAQNSLISTGTSLRKEYGIQNVYLLAPAIPNPLPWLFADSGAGLAEAADLVSFDDPILGDYLQLVSSDPAEQERLLERWLRFFFTNSLGNLVEGTPSTTALELKYVSNEALIMILQLLGSDPFVRPLVDQGIFDRSVQQCFRIAVFSEDLAAPGENLLEEYQALYSHLTGNGQSANVVFIDALDAVHDMYIANPTEVAKVIASCK